MKTTLFAAATALAATGLLAGTAQANHIWVNEFHYNSNNPDQDFIEIGYRSPNSSGVSPSDYVVELYDGPQGTLSPLNQDQPFFLSNFSRSAVLPIAGSTDTIRLYTMFLPTGFPTGTSGGIALARIDDRTGGTVDQFISFGGAFAATDPNGIAAFDNTMSTDVGITEPGSNTTTSLSATGFGFSADQFNPGSFALSATPTPGAINAGQVFTTAVPEPAALGLIGLVGLLLARRRSA